VGDEVGFDFEPYFDVWRGTCPSDPRITSNNAKTTPDLAVELCP